MSSAGRHSRRTRPSSSGIDAISASSFAITGAEMSVPRYSSLAAASGPSSSPLPTPISRIRRGFRARIRSTVAARHSCISAKAIGVPS